MMNPFYKSLPYKLNQMEKDNIHLKEALKDLLMSIENQKDISAIRLNTKNIVEKFDLNLLLNNK